MMQRLHRFLTTEHMLIGAGLVRITVALGILYYLLLHYSQRHLLWGPGGLLPHAHYLEGAEQRGIHTLYEISLSPWFFEAVYHGSILVTFLFLIGFRTRLMGILTFICFWSLYYRNPYITNGGDNIVRLQLFYLLFANLGARFSVDRRLALKKGKKRTTPRPVLAILHNVAVLAATLQLLMMYFTAGIYKVMGSMWQNGTAVYYATRVQEFHWPGVSEHLWNLEPLVVLLTYASVLFQVAFPFLMLNRFTKYLAVFGAILFHASIGLTMNLILFSWYMIGMELILLSDRDYRLIARTARSGWSRGSTRLLGWLARIGETPVLARKRITVFYDGWCPFCRASVDSARKLDWFRLIQFISFRDPGVIERYGLDPAKVEERLHSTNDGNHFHEGIDGITQMVTRLPLLWPSLPFLYLSRALGFGQRVYDWIARRRTIIPTGGCDEHCEVGQRPPSAGEWEQAGHPAERKPS